MQFPCRLHTGVSWGWLCYDLGTIRGVATVDDGLVDLVAQGHFLPKCKRLCWLKLINIFLGLNLDSSPELRPLKQMVGIVGSLQPVCKFPF